jgi:hypothetical protein
VPPKKLAQTWPVPAGQVGPIVLPSTVNPAVKDTGIGSTRSSKVEVVLVDVFVLTNTVLTSMPRQGSIATFITLVTLTDVSTKLFLAYVVAPKAPYGTETPSTVFVQTNASPAGMLDVISTHW